MLSKLLFTVPAQIIVLIIHLTSSLWQSIPSLNPWFVFFGVSSFEDAFGDVDFSNIPFVHESLKTPERTERDAIIDNIRNRSIFSPKILGFELQQSLNLRKARNPEIYVKLAQILPVSCW